MPGAPGEAPPAELLGEPPALLRMAKLVKVYQADGVSVEAIRGVDLERRGGRVRRHHGPVGLG